MSYARAAMPSICNAWLSFAAVAGYHHAHFTERLRTSENGTILFMSVIVNERPATTLSTSDFFFDLPEERIAQHPVEPRDHSRLMVLHRDDHTIEHKHFYEIVDYLKEGDTLVVNDS